jgi:competence protein ComEC
MRSRPALQAACALSAGILWGPCAILPAGLWIAVWTGLLILSLRLPSSGRLRRVSAGSAYGLLVWTGAFLACRSAHWFPPDHVIRSASPPRRVTLTGVLIRDPAARSGRFELLLEADSLGDGPPDFRPVRGRVVVPVTDSLPPPLGYGDAVRITGLLTRPGPANNPGGFDYREWLGRAGIHALLRPDRGVKPLRLGGGRGRFFLRRAVYPARRFVLKVIDSAVPDPDGRALLRSLTVGDQGLVSTDLRDDFSRTGVVHILSVSGSHVGFMFVILSLVTGCLRIPEPWRSAATGAGLVFYALLTEASPPVVRATAMAVAALAGSRLERRADPFNVLGLAAFGILLFRPLDLMDPGFQLSFLSVFSILAGYGKFKSLMNRLHDRPDAAVWKRLEPVLGLAAVSVSAQIGTLAVSARMFNCFPLLSIPANAVAVPLSGAILAVSAATVAAAPVHAGIASAYGALNRFLLAAFIRSIDWIAGLPGACVTVPSPSIGGMLFWYGTVALLFNRRNDPVRRRLCPALLILANAWIWPCAIRPSPRAAAWIQYDVGQGDAALFLFPGGETLLVDAGPADGRFDSGERTIAPFLRRTGVRRIDAVVLTHPHGDHVGGAAYLARHFRVGALLAPALPDSNRAWAGLAKTARRERVPFRIIRNPDSLTFSKDVRVYLLNPSPAGGMRNNPAGSANDHSLITIVRFGRSVWLSMGDAGFSEEEALASAWKGGRCDAVKIGHHGSASSTSAGFLARFTPGLAVVSVGAGNRYGHPSDRTMDRIRASGCTALRTDERGAVILEADGITTRIVDWKKTSGIRGLIRCVFSGPFVSRYGS